MSIKEKSTTNATNLCYIIDVIQMTHTHTNAHGSYLAIFLSCFFLFSTSQVANTSFWKNTMHICDKLLRKANRQILNLILVNPNESHSTASPEERR